MEGIKFCILTNEKDIDDFERGIYRTYLKNNKDGWVSCNYQVINGCKLRSKISYDNQIIYSFKKKNNIVIAGAVAINKNTNFQFKEMGFKIPEDKKNYSFAEGITFYANDKMLGEDFLTLIGNFFKNAEIDLKKRNIKYLFTTCERHMKAMYTLMGFDILDKKTIDGVKQFFLVYEIN